MKKRLLSLALCAVMSAGLIAGCGSSDSSESSGTSSSGSAAESSEEASTDTADVSNFPEETIKIGVESFDTTDEQFMALQEYLDYLADNMNLEMVYSESIDSAEAEMDFIDSCASAGCDAIFAYYNVSPEAIQETIDKGMYYWGTEQYAPDYEDNEYYVGCYTFTEDDSEENGDYLGGYELGYSLGEQGVKHVFYCNGGASFGVQMFIDRQSGFEAGIAAAQADGYEIEYDSSADVIEGWPGTDDFTAAVSSKLSGDYDGAAVSFNAATLFQPINDAGKADSIKIAAIGGVNDTYYDAFNNGLVSTIVYDCEEVVFGNGIVAIINAVTGHGDVTRDGDAAGRVLTYRWTLTDPDQFNAIYDMHDAGEYYITASDVANLCAEYNSSITFDEINEYYQSFTLENTVK